MLIFRSPKKKKNLYKSDPPGFGASEPRYAIT